MHHSVLSKQEIYVAMLNGLMFRPIVPLDDVILDARRISQQMFYRFPNYFFLSCHSFVIQSCSCYAFDQYFVRQILQMSQRSLNCNSIVHF